MKIALLTKYGDLAASTRQRFHQYKPYLEDVGFEIAAMPLLDNDYLKRLYRGRRRHASHIAKCYLNRLLWLISKPDIDLIWLHCELFPFLPGVLELLAKIPGKPIVFDYDDAIFHNYDQHSNRFVRALMGQKLHSTIGAAELAICGNDYLATYASQFCPRIQVVPTVVDVDVYCPRTKSVEETGSTRIGWIGTPSTWAEYMQSLMPTLISAATTMDASLSVMGADHTAPSHPLLEVVDWSEAGEVPFLKSLDIGIMPLTDTPWARGKCGYKLIQYMACGLPVIASPVGVNSDIVEHGVNGFLVTNNEEWFSALQTLVQNADLRRRMGEAGRRKVEQHYSLQVCGPRIAKLLLEVAKP